jgi:hypothetical protein
VTELEAQLEKVRQLTLEAVVGVRYDGGEKNGDK